VLEGSERRSLAYKLAAQAGAAIHLLPALQAAGHDLGAVVHRWVRAAQRVAANDRCCSRLTVLKLCLLLPLLLLLPLP